MDQFEAVLGDDQNIVAEGLDEDEEAMSEEEDDEEEDSEYGSIDEDEEEDEEMGEADENDDSILVTSELLNEWSAAANKKTPAAWKKMLMAFRSIVRSDEETPTKFTYRVESSKG